MPKPGKTKAQETAKLSKGDRARAREADSAQPPLIPMGDDEVRKAGRTLARKIADLETMELEHDAERREMREAEANLKGEIAAIASTITNQGR